MAVWTPRYHEVRFSSIYRYKNKQPGCKYPRPSVTGVNGHRRRHSTYQSCNRNKMNNTALIWCQILLPHRPNVVIWLMQHVYTETLIWDVRFAWSRTEILPSTTHNKSSEWHVFVLLTGPHIHQLEMHSMVYRLMLPYVTPHENSLVIERRL